MKCPRCLAVCMPADPMCYSCRAPLGSHTAAGGRRKPTQVEQFALLLAVAGCVGGGKFTQILLGPSSPAAEMAAGGIGGGLGALILGMPALILARLSSKQSRPEKPEGRH